MPPCQGGERRFESGREDVYDISKINSVAELEELVSDMNLLINDKKTDASLKKRLIETRSEAQRKIKVLRKQNGM